MKTEIRTNSNEEVDGRNKPVKRSRRFYSLGNV